VQSDETNIVKMTAELLNVFIGTTTVRAETEMQKNDISK